MSLKRSTDASPLLVVKIGGSLFKSSRLARWVRALKTYPHRLVVVCGGGPFSDAVRDNQKIMRFNDIAAHEMALLAMEQYAIALNNLFDLALASSVPEIQKLHDQGHIALWRPSLMTLEACELNPSWNTTSDSLSAWLADQLSASALILIKSLDIKTTNKISELIANEVIDRSFQDYLKKTPAYIAGPACLKNASHLFSQGEYPGVPLFYSSQKIAS